MIYWGTGSLDLFRNTCILRSTYPGRPLRIVGDRSPVLLGFSSYLRNSRSNPLQRHIFICGASIYRIAVAHRSLPPMTATGEALKQCRTETANHCSPSSSRRGSTTPHTSYTHARTCTSLTKKKHISRSSDRSAPVSSTLVKR